MSELRGEEELLRKYLLGELPEEEQIRIEERLLLDSDYVELLQIVEEELIDGYARGSLSGREREQLEERIAGSPLMQRKLRVARPFVSRADGWPSGDDRSLWRTWAERVRRLVVLEGLTPALRAATAVVAVAAAAVIAWQLFLYQSPADKARVALQDSFRESPTEARMSGFKWPPRRATLGAQSGPADEISLDRAKTLSQEAVATKGNSDSHHALGQFYLANGELDKAIRE